MIFRQAMPKELEQVMQIIRQAQADLKEAGINQWQNNYPNEEVIQADIIKGQSYVLVEREKVLATVVVSFKGEPTYDNIYEGKWLSSMPYAVVHRIAVSKACKGQGVASILMHHIEAISLIRNVKSIKVDTHPDNEAMKCLLDKNEFTYCGVIYLADGSKRIAFEKLLY